MPGDDAALSVHEDRVVEPELRDTGGDMRYLRLQMRPRISRVRNEFVERPKFDVLCTEKVLRLHLAVFVLRGKLDYKSSQIICKTMEKETVLCY